MQEFKPVSSAFSRNASSLGPVFPPVGILLEQMPLSWRSRVKLLQGSCADPFRGACLTPAFFTRSDSFLHTGPCELLRAHTAVLFGENWGMSFLWEFLSWCLSFPRLV